MRRLVSALTASAFLLATACGEGEKSEEPAEEPTLPGLECNQTNTLGNVSLKIEGQPGDEFRVIMKCGNQEVARCMATVAAGETTGKCVGSGPVPNGGTRSCTVGPAAGNSNAAREVGHACG
jgi:hypothetical protein